MRGRRNLLDIQVEFKSKPDNKYQADTLLAELNPVDNSIQSHRI